MTGFSGLVPYYDEFVPQHFVKANGKPIGKRAAQKYAAKHNLPLVKLGHCTFIDPVLAAERLRQAQLTDRMPRRAGRPRKTG